MNLKHVDLLVECRNQVGESPVWSSRDAALYWVDIPAGEIHSWCDGKHRVWQAPEMVGCIAPASEGNAWIAGMQTGIYRIELGQPRHCSTSLLAKAPHGPNMRFNDGRCDRQGRFTAGTMDLDMGRANKAGELLRLNTDRSLSTLAASLIVPNGLAFSRDGTRMYLSDSHPTVQVIWKFEYDVRQGTASHPEIFVDMRNFPGRPDGAAVDEEDCYWTCANDAGMIHRFTPDGKLDRTIKVPVLKPSMCAFGGPDLRTLFVTSIRPQGVDLSGQPLAGSVFALRVGVKGLLESEWTAPSV